MAKTAPRPRSKQLDKAAPKVSKKQVWMHRLVVSLHVLVWVALTSVLFQLLYPADRALPGQRLDGERIGFQTKEEVTKKLDVIAADATLTVTTPVRQRTVQWSTIGITMDRLATAEAIVEYQWWERLLPFSIVVRAFQAEHVPLVIVEKERLSAFAEQIVNDDKRSIKEAVITVKNGRVRIEAAQAGFSFNARSVEAQLQTTPFATTASIALKPNYRQATHTKKEVAKVAEEAQTLINQPVQLSFAGQSIRPEANVIGTWFRVEEHKQTKRLQPAIDRTALRHYLDTLSKRYSSPPPPVQITLLDGQEIKRTASRAGLGMNIGKAEAIISRAILDPAFDTALELPVERTEPRAVYQRTYSQNSAGLSALINYWEQTTYGNYGIVVREIGGQNRYADFGADKIFVTSSTFKMFLAYTVFKKIEQGLMSPGQPSGLAGWSVEACVTEMITNSTNPCAIALQSTIGQAEVNRMLHKAGFMSTQFDNSTGGDKYTTVRDEANFLLRLRSGTLMNPAHTSQLLDLMKRQIWRGGIPSGVPYGTVVANKVGFYDGWVHDVAIVYGPTSTYILAIMSRGGSDPVFADLSRQVYDFFNRL